ncbi:MAG: tetratricopeptide repeat protein [Candidatus Omnitrophica bacterium]|nr:tetratricopeptide repeat protein [Candidatus Omnitrophota bacterium]
MKKGITCLLILILFLTQICFAQETPKEAELLFMAKKAYEDGFYEVALGMLERFQNDFPNSARYSETRLLVGQSYFHQGRYLEALNILEALLADPKTANLKDAIYFWIAELYFKGDNFDKAIAFYQKLINDFPHSSYVPAAYYSLGWAYSQMGQYSQALVSLKSLLESFPSEPQSKDAAFKLMECLYNLKEYSELKNKIKSVLKLYINDPLRLPYLYFYLAESEYYLDDLEEAAKDYFKAAQAFRDEKARALANLGLGWSYLKIKKYDEAEEIFAGINQDNLDKKSLDILILGQAVLMSQSNRVYEAKKFYQQLIDSSTDPLIRLQAYIGKADAFYSLAEYAQAIKTYEEGLNKAVKAGAQINGSVELIDKLRYNLGLAYIKEGNIQSGVTVFQNAADKSPDPDIKAGALCQAGDACQDAGDYLKAEEIYSRILKDFPDSSFADYALYQSGLSQLKRSDYESAIATFKLLPNSYPQSKFLENSDYLLGVVYFDKQDFISSSEILARFQNKFKESRLSAQAVFMLGLSLLNLGKVNDALNIFKDIPRKYPQELELIQKAEYEVADCYYRLGQEKEALKRFKLLRAKYPDSKLAPEIMWWLGQYYYRLNDLSLAARYFGSLAKDFPDSSLSGDALYALGLIFKDENNLDQALESFKSALKMEKGSSKTEAALGVADIYFQQGNLEGALNEYKRMLKTHPDLGSFLFSRIARCYYKMLDYEQAKLFYQKVLDLTDVKNAGDIQLSLAEVYEANNELDAACELYLKVADTHKDNQQLSTSAFLRCAKIYEDRDDFKAALAIYMNIPQDDTEESRFVRERIEWIKTNVKIK